jgi:hypothetical membrane protein
MSRTAGFLGIGACAIFWSASFAFGALRPGYSHSIHTISELGVIGAPNATLWNIVGFIVPGLLLAVTGGALARAVRRERSNTLVLAGLLLVVAGLAVAGQGLIPAEMIRGVADVTSPYTRGHFISSLVSGAAWAIGALLLVKPMKQNPDWRGWRIVSVVLVIMTLIASFTLRGVLPDGLAQRIGNIIFHAWFILMSVRLIQLGDGKAPAAAKPA